MQGVFEPVQPRMSNASPVVLKKKKYDNLRVYLDYIVHLNGRRLPITRHGLSFPHFSCSLFLGKSNFSSANYQIKFDDGTKEFFTINTQQGLIKMCRLPQELKNASSIFQICTENLLKGIKGVIILQDDLLFYGTSGGKTKSV